MSSDKDDGERVATKRHCPAGAARSPGAGTDADATTTWNNAVAWVESCGGYVHPSLAFSSDDRTVRVMSAVEADVPLMKIPSRCLVAPESLEGSPFGRELLKAGDAAAAALHNDLNDLLVAFYMAYLSTSGGAGEGNAEGELGAYLATLPPPESYDAIPRRWTNEQLESLLGGTALIARSRKDRRNLRSDYDAIASAWIELMGKSEGQSALPPYNSFDDMHAAVSSRGFAGLGSSDGTVDAMVPLLDLLDHRRGVGGKRDVRYSRDEREESKSDGSPTEGIVCVTADRFLDAESAVCDTYGAKGNSQLLSRYGFCLENNIEPDGSSNDVLEFTISPDQPPVELRAGPKSYTYGGFVRALELCYERNINPDADVKENNGDDMDAFLNQCEDEDEGEAFGMMYGDLVGGDEDDGGDDEDHADDGTATRAECGALDKLAEALESARQGFSMQGETLKSALCRKDASPAYFAALLVQSEQRTIGLFQSAVRQIRLKIADNESVTKRASYKGTKDASSNGERARLSSLIENQVDELVVAYLTIRHPT